MFNNCALLHRASLVQCCCSPAVPRCTKLFFTEPRFNCGAVQELCLVFTKPRLDGTGVRLLCQASPGLASTGPLFVCWATLHRASLQRCRCSPAAPRFTELPFFRASLPRCCCSSAVPRFAEPCFHGTVDRLLWNASLTLVFFTEPRFHGTADRLLCHASPSLAAMVPLFACCATLHRALLPWCHCSTAVCRFTKIVFNGAAAHWLCRALLSIAATVPLFV